eukprot:3377863-Amphidinium_carterae.1
MLPHLHQNFVEIIKRFAFQVRCDSRITCELLQDVEHICSLFLYVPAFSDGLRLHQREGGGAILPASGSISGWSGNNTYPPTVMHQTGTTVDLKD